MGILRELLKYYFFMILVFFMGRVVLFILYFDRFSSDKVNYWLTFLYGLKMDTMMAGYLLILPVLFLTLTPNVVARFVNSTLKYYFIFIISFLIYIEVATIPFVAQYDVRPNYLFVQYLEYPKEVFSMIFASYKLQFLISIILISLFVYSFHKYYKNGFLPTLQSSYKQRLSMFIPLALLLLLGIRSSFEHKPANITVALYSQNRILNEVTKNSLYSIVWAIDSNLKYESNDISKLYGKMNMKEAIKRVKKLLDIQSINEKYFLTRIEPSHFKTVNTKNLVIFLQESLGWQFVESVGGEHGITPNLNSLSKEGLLFKNLYSNGTRSIRGIAGTVAGSFSMPGGKGVVRRIKSETNWFTLAQIYKPLGYHLSFMYGGDSRFENMKGWFLGNGFDEVLDQDTFTDPTYTATWGVCDGDVVNRANEEFKKMYEQHQKFATVIFSTSNHLPFEFPTDKIDLIDGIEVNSVKNAIKYADYAIGDLIKKARKEAYYKDTIFVVVADHNVRVYGDDVVPVNMFHIPGLILGDNVKPQIYNEVSSQSDVLATAIDLTGVNTQTPIMGHSIFSDKKQHLSLMQFNDRYALMVDNKVAVLRSNAKPLSFIYENQHLTATNKNDALEKDALALILVLDHMYQNKLYKNDIEI